MSTIPQIAIPQFKVPPEKARRLKRHEIVELSLDEALNQIDRIASVHLLHDEDCLARAGGDGWCHCEPRLRAIFALDSTWTPPVYHGLSIDALRQLARQPARAGRLVDGSEPHAYRSDALDLELSEQEEHLRSILREDVTRDDLFDYIDDSLSAAKRILK